MFSEEKNEIELRRKRKYVILLLYIIIILLLLYCQCRFRTRSDLYKFITPDYYGYRDDDDGILVMKEIEIEVGAVRLLVDGDTNE